MTNVIRHDGNDCNNNKGSFVTGFAVSEEIKIVALFIIFVVDLCMTQNWAIAK